MKIHIQEMPGEEDWMLHHQLLLFQSFSENSRKVPRSIWLSPQSFQVHCTLSLHLTHCFSLTSAYTYRFVPDGSHIYWHGTPTFLWSWIRAAATTQNEQCSTSDLRLPTVWLLTSGSFTTHTKLSTQHTVHWRTSEVCWRWPVQVSTCRLSSPSRFLIVFQILGLISNWKTYSYTHMHTYSVSAHWVKK
jgi:hypothetical protein